jgi:hypothetical protein
MSVFADARKGKNLSPAQRAFLKLVEGFIIAGVVAALPVLSLALSQQNVNWEGVLRVALGTFATAALMGAVKYLKAQGDAPLAQETAAGLTAVAAGVGQWAGLNDVGNKPAPVPALGDAPGIVPALCRYAGRFPMKSRTPCTIRATCASSYALYLP